MVTFADTQGNEHDSKNVSIMGKQGFTFVDLSDKLQQKKTEIEASRRRAAEEADRKRRESSKWFRTINSQEYDLQRIRQQEELGYPNWQAKDFGGAYHETRIANKFPIAGTAIEVEQIRKKGIITRKEREEKELADIQAVHVYRAQEKGKFAEQRELFRGQYSERVYLEADVQETLESRKAKLARLRRRFQRERNAFTQKADSSMKDFIHAVREGRLERVQGYLQRRTIDVNSVTSYNEGQTALMEACIHGRVTMAKMLLEMGADPDQKSARGEGTLHVVWNPVVQTPRPEGLHRVVLLRNIYTLIECLLDAGADPSMVNTQSLTTLHFAAAEQSTAVCELILRKGNTALLDQTDSQGQTPLDVAPDQKHESYKLLLNWKACVQGNKLTDFQKAWFHYMNAPAAGPRLAVQPSAGTVIAGLRITDYKRQAGTELREGVVQRRREDIAADQTNVNAGLESTGDKLVEKKSVAEYVQLAQKQYTASFRAKCKAERQKKKPSDRKLTLVEYLVGYEARKRAEELDKTSKSKRSKSHLLDRRKAIAHALLKDNYRGGPERTRRRDLEDVPLEATDDEHLAADVLQNNVLRRPWTVSTIGRSGGAFHPRVLGRVVANTQGAPDKTSTIDLTPSHYATRKAGVKRITGKLHSQEENINESDIAHAESQQKIQQKLDVKSPKEHLMRRMTVRIENVLRDEGAISDNTYQTQGDTQELSAEHSIGSKRPLTGAKTKRKRAIAQEANMLQAIQASIESAAKNSKYTGSKFSHEAEMYRSKHVPDSVMPPKYNMREILSSLALDANGKTSFTRLEVASVLTLLRARLPGDTFPMQLSNAILRAIHPDERADAGNVTVAELRERFQDFRYNKRPFDTVPAFDALEKALEARYRDVHLHSSLHEYRVYSTKELQRPGPFDSRPVNTEPWAGSHVQVNRTRVLCDRLHDENPLKTSGFRVLHPKVT